MIHANNLPRLSALRVTLRALTAADIDSLFAIFSDPQTMRYWSSPPMQDVDEAATLLAEIHESFEKRSLFQWGIARRSDDRVIGTCTLLHLDANNRRAEVGYALGSPFWGQGYMNEGLYALLDFSFDSLNLHRVEADTDPRNAASIRLLERLGFAREGHLRERWLVGDEVCDSLIFGLLRSEWNREKTGGL